jgi:alcohol sulfotransferase
LHWRLRGQPIETILREERTLRGKEQLDTLQQADIVIVSFGKSGRTWLRVMLSHLFRVMYQLPENAVMSFDNFHNLNRAVPKVFFTHDNYIKDFTGDFHSKKPFYDKRVVLLARDPRDVAVSQFFQWKFRIKPSKLAINNYPSRDADISLYDFVTGDNGGGSMRAVTEFLNLWASEAGSVENFHVLRYEDLRAAPHEELRRLLDFMQVDASVAHVDAAVDYSSYENMKKMEGSSQFRLSGDRLKPGDKGNPDSFKVRRAKVGGYRDYFDDDQVDAIDRQLANTLSPVFRYSSTD